MLINDRYHDQFKRWVRDMKDADIDWQAGKHLIKRGTLSYELQGRGIHLLRLFGGLAGGPVVLFGLASQNAFVAVGGASLTLGCISSCFYTNYIDSKINKIREVANYQRRCMGEKSIRQGTYVRGASRTSNLDQL